MSAFEHTSLVSLHNSFGTTQNLWETHTKWLKLIRDGVWLRVDSDRCLWILNLWNFSTINEVELPGKYHCIELSRFYLCNGRGEDFIAI